MNTTAGVQRRGVFLSFVVNGASTEKNMFLTLPMGTAKAIPVQVQELLCHKADANISVTNVGSLMALL